MKKFANIYIGMLVLYYAQGAFYSVGSLFSRLLLVIVLLISIYYFIYANSHYSLPQPLKILSFLVLVFTVYGIIPIVTGTSNLSRSIPPFLYIKNLYLSLLPIYVFYVFWRKEWVDETAIRRWFLVFLAVAVAGFYNNNIEALEEARALGSSREEFTNNQSYTILSLICLLPLFYKKSFVQYSLLAIIMFYVVIGFKRGAILAGAVCLVWFIMQSFKTENTTKVSFRRVFRLILVVGIVLSAIYLFQYLLDTSDYFITRIERTREGDSSGRDELFSVLFYHFINETSVIKFLFGNGAYGTLEVVGNGAHNDWLEIAIDNGFVFLVVYLVYWIKMFSMLFKGDRLSISTTMMGLFVIIYFMKTLFSMSINSTTPYAACALAYAMVNYQEKERIRQ